MRIDPHQLASRMFVLLLAFAVSLCCCRARALVAPTAPPATVDAVCVTSCCSANDSEAPPSGPDDCCGGCCVKGTGPSLVAAELPAPVLAYFLPPPALPIAVAPMPAVEPARIPALPPPGTSLWRQRCALIV